MRIGEENLKKKFLSKKRNL
jgi:hypothetical protein